MEVSYLVLMLGTLLMVWLAEKRLERIEELMEEMSHLMKRGPFDERRI